jgi:hypothetical protein
MITPELKRIYASAPSGRFYVETLELSHSLFPQTFYINNNLKLWRFDLGDGTMVDFDPVPFQAIQPPRDGRGRQDLKLVIDNVGRDAMEALEAAAALPQENIKVTCRIYINVAETPPQNDPPLVLTLSDIEVSTAAITGVATRADTLNKPFPFYHYRVDNFPGLNR